MAMRRSDPVDQLDPRCISMEEMPSSPSLLSVMLLSPNLSARLTLFVMQIGAFGAREFAVRFVSAFELTDVALFFAYVSRLAARQFA